MYERYSHSYLGHISPYPAIEIACRTQKRKDGDSYPILVIADATFLPTIAQLETLHAVIGKYLGEQKTKDSSDQQVDADLEAAHEAFASGG